MRELALGRQEKVGPLASRQVECTMPPDAPPISTSFCRCPTSLDRRDLVDERKRALPLFATLGVLEIGAGPRVHSILASFSQTTV